MEMLPSDRLAQDRLLALETGVAALFFHSCRNWVGRAGLVSLSIAFLF